MEKPKIIINGVEHEIRQLTGRDWRVMGEFIESAPDFTDVDYLVKHAEFVANFYTDLTVDDILDLPIEDILPASTAVRNYIVASLTAKFEKIEKNVEAGKAQ